MELYRVENLTFTYPGQFAPALRDVSLTVRQGAKALTRAQHTDVYFRPATQRELKAYIAGGEPMDKAGAYGVQGQGALLVERIDGDFFNVMGLPVVLLAEMLGEFGIQLLG